MSWLFTEERLHQIRLWSNQRSVEYVKKVIHEEMLLEGKTPDFASIEFITAQEQLDLCRFYEHKISDYCKVFKFDLAVQATSIAFFKRFYLFSSMMDYDPKNILLTSLFLATKVENAAISLEDFLKKVPKAPSAQTLLDLEFQLSQGIRFEYMIHHPFWPLHGYFLDIQAYLQQSASTRDTLQEGFKRLAQTYSKARDLAIISLKTDMQFIMSPSQIAMSCLFMAARETDFMEDLDTYFKHRLQDECDKIAALMGSQNIQEQKNGHEGDGGDQDSSLVETLDGDQVYNTLKENCRKAEVVLKKAKDSSIDKTTAQHIDRKLKTCQNPEFKADSLISKKRLELERLEREEKRHKKMQLDEDNEKKMQQFLK